MTVEDRKLRNAEIKKMNKEKIYHRFSHEIQMGRNFLDMLDEHLTSPLQERYNKLEIRYYDLEKKNKDDNKRHSDRIAELELKVGQQALEIGRLLKGVGIFTEEKFDEVWKDQEKYPDVEDVKKALGIKK